MRESQRALVHLLSTSSKFISSLASMVHAARIVGYIRIGASSSPTASSLAAASWDLIELEQLIKAVTTLISSV